MVDFLKLVVIRQSAVQGERDPNAGGARVVSYFIYHSIDGETWFPILEKEHVKVQIHSLFILHCIIHCMTFYIHNS